MMIVVHILTVLLFAYLALTLSYLFILAIAGRFGRVGKYSLHPDKASIAVIIPSYKDDSVILDTAIQALQQQYPKDRFTVTVIADQLQPATVQQLKELPITLVEVFLEKSMKAKSLNAAFQQLPSGKFDLALILDADNVMSPDTLEKVNHAWHSGWKVMQCHRTAKNKNTSIAVLDALSEEINNTIFRRGQRALGLSSALIGSGMAFQYDLLKGIFALPRIQDNPGEDKEIEIELLKQRIVIEYIEDAYIYDEKVQRKEVFEKQRTRWLAAQAYNIKLFLAKDLRRTFPQKNYLHKFFQATFLPRLLLMFIFLLTLGLCAIDILTHAGILMPSYTWWIALVGLYALTMVTAVPAAFYNRQTFRAFLKVPVLMFSMIKALLGMKKNKTKFLHTPKEFSQ